MARNSRADSSEKENTPAGKSMRRSSTSKNRAKQPQQQTRVDGASDADEMQIDKQPASQAAANGNEQDDDNNDDDEEMETAASRRRKSKGKASSRSRQQEEEPEDQDGAGEQNDEQEEEQEENEQGQYDPDQPLEEKRKIRKEYRDLTSNLNAERARDPEALTAARITEGIATADRFFSTVKNPAEAILDSQFLMATSEVAMNQARKLKIGGDYFDTDDFLNKIKIVVSGAAVRRVPGSQNRRRRNASDDEDDEEYAGTRDPVVGWDSIGKLATRHTLRVPPIDFMLGPIAIPQKKKVQKKQRVQQARLKESDRVQAKELDLDDIQAEVQTTELVRKVCDILEKEGGGTGVSFFKFFINPESFTQTVENLFYISFLVKDRKASIEYNDEQEPIISIPDACEPPNEEDRSEGIKARQLVMELDMQMWQDAIEAYDITKPMIPTREYQERVRGKWYG